METLRALIFSVLITGMILGSAGWLYFQRTSDVSSIAMSEETDGTFEFQTASGRWAESNDEDEAILLEETTATASTEGDESNDSVSSDSAFVLAACLTDSGWTMYGAYWCPHCTAQKDLFGAAFEAIHSVECAEGQPDSQPDRCVEAGIQAYPTWIDGEGQAYEGGRTLQELAELSGCSL